jgi:hypothetical protein
MSNDVSRTSIALVAAGATFFGALFGSGMTAVVTLKVERDRATQEARERTIDRATTAYSDFAVAAEKFEADYRATAGSLLLVLDDPPTVVNDPALAASVGVRTPLDVLTTLTQDHDALASASAKVTILGDEQTASDADYIERNAGIIVSYASQLRNRALAVEAGLPDPFSRLTFTRKDINRIERRVSKTLVDFLYHAQADTTEYLR